MPMEYKDFIEDFYNTGTRAHYGELSENTDSIEYISSTDMYNVYMESLVTNWLGWQLF